MSNDGTEASNGQSIERSKLFDFWKDVPVLAVIPGDKFSAIGDHPIRYSMMHILRKGLLDEDTNRRRHALNLGELLPLLENDISNRTGVEQQLKRTALYHHRDVLLEHGVLQEVATLLEGKRYVTYYGRTAKGFIGEGNSSKKTESHLDMLKQILPALNPGMTGNDLHDLLVIHGKELDGVHQRILSWIESHVELINELDLDAIQLYELVAPYFISGLASVSKIFNLLDIAVDDE